MLEGRKLFNFGTFVKSVNIKRRSKEQLASRVGGGEVRFIQN